MAERDPFHEARTSLGTLQREFTTNCGSLNVAVAYIAGEVCDQSMRAVYNIAMGETLPHALYRPPHNPLGLAQALGIERRYSPETRAFLTRLQGYALPAARFEGTKAYEQHVAPQAKGRARDLFDGATRCLAESEVLASDVDVLATVRANKRMATARRERHLRARLWAGVRRVLGRRYGPT